MLGALVIFRVGVDEDAVVTDVLPEGDAFMLVGVVGVRDGMAEILMVADGDGLMMLLNAAGSMLGCGDGSSVIAT